MIRKPTLYMFFFFLFIAKTSFAYESPFLYRALNNSETKKELSSTADALLAEFEAKFKIATVRSEFKDKELLTPEYILSVRQALESDCTNKIFGLILGDDNVQLDTNIEFDYVLRAKGSVGDTYSGPVNDTYRDGSVVRMIFRAKVDSCISSCESTSFSFGPKTYEIYKSCSAAPRARKVSDVKVKK